MLWYQIEPIQAYLHVGEYDRVLSLTAKILANQNRAFSELYELRAEVFEARGDMQQAAAERSAAYRYRQPR